MPDHLHLIVHGQSETAQCKGFIALALNASAPGQKRMRLQNLTEERKKEAGAGRGVEFEGIGESRQPHRPALKKLVPPSNLPFFCNRQRL
ncbi:MAG: hypothetical protein EHM55_08230, partial [Acidobacteria bacterium]